MIAAGIRPEPILAERRAFVVLLFFFTGSIVLTADFFSAGEDSGRACSPAPEARPGGRPQAWTPAPQCLPNTFALRLAALCPMRNRVPSEALRSVEDRGDAAMYEDARAALKTGARGCRILAVNSSRPHRPVPSCPGSHMELCSLRRTGWKSSINACLSTAN